MMKLTMNNTLTRPERKVLRLEKKRAGAERRAERLESEVASLKEQLEAAQRKIKQLEWEVHNLEFPPEPERW